MVLKNAFIAIAATCALLAGSSGASVADEYRPGEFLGLDLSSAVLSPKPLGPPAEFEPVPLEARGDSDGAQAVAEPTSEPRLHVQTPRIVERNVAEPRVEARKSRHAARTRLARRRGNPLDAQAFDTRIQVWPCRSGGICNWRR